MMSAILSLALLLGNTMNSIAVVIPIGNDAITNGLDLWPLKRDGVRALMHSTFDRMGGNEAADSSHYTHITSDNRAIVFSEMGQGVLYFCRFNHWHGSPWHFKVDGTIHTVNESNTANPNKTPPVSPSLIYPTNAFPSILAPTFATTQGADLSWVPMMFSRSLELSYSRTHYGTGYCILHMLQPEILTSRPLTPWSMDTMPINVSETLALSGSASVFPRENCSRFFDTMAIFEQTQSTIELFSVGSEEGPEAIRIINFSLPASNAKEFGTYWIRIYFDEQENASVAGPMAMMFGAGELQEPTSASGNTSKDEGDVYLVKAYPAYIKFTGSSSQGSRMCELIMYYPMPFSSKVRIVITRANAVDKLQFMYAIGIAPVESNLAKNFAYFHATYQDTPTPTPGRDVLMLDTKGVEGQTSWSGHLVGTVITFSYNGVLNTLEGDPRFHLDDSRSPQIQGTGTEEWGGGGDYFQGGQRSTLPLAGHPNGKKSGHSVDTLYRFLLSDLIPFGYRAQVAIEHGGQDQSLEHYTSLVFWYGVPNASLVLTDSITFNDTESLLHHNYTVPSETSTKYTVDSRFELGVDHLNGNTSSAEVYPSQNISGIVHSSVSSFTVNVAPQNKGIMLRRTLDLAYADQNATVAIRSSATNSCWRLLKAPWFTGGSNTVVFSDPSTETGEPMTSVKLETSNRRFRDVEYLIPSSATKNCTKVDVMITYQKVTQDIFPGQPFPKQDGWTEFGWEVWSIVY
eukprot:m.345599 g.345599  ORF g.345599 m.345599 type:complete len:741 (+) comp26860_c0_seq1:167-2389(+)